MHKIMFIGIVIMVIVFVGSMPIIPWISSFYISEEILEEHGALSNQIKEFELDKVGFENLSENPIIMTLKEKQVYIDRVDEAIAQLNSDLGNIENSSEWEIYKNKQNLMGLFSSILFTLGFGLVWFDLIYDAIRRFKKKSGLNGKSEIKGCV